MNHNSSFLSMNRLNCSINCKNEQNSLFQIRTLSCNDTEKVFVCPNSDEENTIDNPSSKTENYSSYQNSLNSMEKSLINTHQNNDNFEFRSPVSKIEINSYEISDSLKPHNATFSSNDNNPSGKSTDLNFPVSDHHHHHQCQCNISSSEWDKWSFLSSISGCSTKSDCTVTTTHKTDEPLKESETLAKFVDIFKEKRIKLGITQAEVGRALGALNVSGFGCLSQSTICRFESLSLSHKNMLALKPVLEIWLKQMEDGLDVNQEHYFKESFNCLNCTSTDFTDLYENSSYSPTNSPVLISFNPSKKSVQNQRRKRMSIMGREKSILESFFNAIDCRPNSEQMNQLAVQLNMPKSVIRVWFCNQRQKNKRLSQLLTNSLSEGK
ncbi:unnamed protein product [Schistosoma turkestanicum]|nr:unnamed protein product [Schistosoma turkestanicum]